MQIKLRITLAACCMGLTAALLAAGEKSKPAHPTTQPAKSHKMVMIADGEVLSMEEHSFVMRIALRGDADKPVEVTFDTDGNTVFTFVSMQSERTGSHGSTVNSFTSTGPAAWKDVKPGARVMVPLPAGVSPAHASRALATRVSILAAAATSQPATQPE